MSGWFLGVMGGSGLYALDGLADARWERVETAFGGPSDEILVGRLGEVRLAFLPRHGRGHVVPPGEINARANIMALKMLGCTDVLSVSAVGSLREEMAPGDFVVVDQFIDRTKGRQGSFFGAGLVAHVPLAAPVCARLSGLAGDAARRAGARVHEGATYLAMEGPQFSTRAESRLYRAWGADVIGMTAMPEARLAREAELPYALVGMVTDYDSWREADDVDVAEIIKLMGANGAKARTMVRGLAGALPGVRAGVAIDRVLDSALITAPEKRDADMMRVLQPILARVLG